MIIFIIINVNCISSRFDVRQYFRSILHETALSGKIYFYVYCNNIKYNNRRIDEINVIDFETKLLVYNSETKQVVKTKNKKITIFFFAVATKNCENAYLVT